MFMSAAATNSTHHPAPNPAGADQQGPAGRLLNLVRRLIDYGKELAATFQRRGPDAELAHNFGTTDIGQILACITRGLQRAQALEARVVRVTARLDAPPKPRNPSPAPPPRVAPAVRPVRDARRLAG